MWFHSRFALLTAFLILATTGTWALVSISLKRNLGFRYSYSSNFDSVTLPTVITKERTTLSSSLHATINPSIPSISSFKFPRFQLSPKLRKRWATGLSLGAIGTLWIVGGNGLFMLGFLFMSQICLSEYFSMVKAVGVMPAEKTGLLSSLMCYVVAAMLPQYHELVMPISATLLVLWLLIFNKKSASISEISTSLLGMFYIGYLPSFWVRLRALNTATFTVPTVLSNFNAWLPEALNQGSIITWWTWFSIVVADVSAYFVGKRYGKHKLSALSAAAGSASPNKTVEGALGGFLSCIVLTMMGGYLMNWPYWQVTGFVYGLVLSFIALVGDLTASMMKRDAKMKDTGNILPGHGGVLDRFDSYMFTAPVAYCFYRHVIPFAQMLAKKVI